MGRVQILGPQVKGHWNFTLSFSQVARLANNGSSASTEILQQAKSIFLVGPILTEEMVDMLFAIFTDQFKYWHYYHL